MDKLFFMTANRFQKSWLRRLVDEAYKDPEGVMLKARSLGWTDSYSRIAEHVAMEAWLEANRAGFAAYVLPNPIESNLDKELIAAFPGMTIDQIFSHIEPLPSPGKMRLIVAFVRFAYPAIKKENHGFV